MSVLDDLVEHILPPDCLRGLGTPSVSIALLDEAGYSCARVITNGKEDTNTVYQACSISKAITALAVAKLVDLSKLTYDDKVVDLVSPRRLREIGKTEADMKAVTIGALVSHRSGLSQHGFPGYTADKPTIDDIFNGHCPANTPRIRFSSFPFSQFSYSGGGYLLLQLCLQCVLERPFSQIMHNTVLSPLDMTRSWYTDLPDGEHNFAKAHMTSEQVTTSSSRGYHRFVELAAAGLWTTPTDLLKAISSVQYSLEHDDGFLSRSIAQQMLTKVTPNDERYSMAMGWASDDSCFGHSGDNQPGYNCYFFGTHQGLVNASERSPGFKGGLAIMTNSVLGFSMIQKVVAAIFFLKRWPLLRSLPSRFGSLLDFVPCAAPHDTYFDDRWQVWQGEWSDGWIIIDNKGSPQLLFASMESPVPLRPAAAPTLLGEQLFVAEGHEIALGLSERDGKRQLRIVQSEGVHHTIE